MAVGLQKKLVDIFFGLGTAEQVGRELLDLNSVSAGVAGLDRLGYHLVHLDYFAIAGTGCPDKVVGLAVFDLPVLADLVAVDLVVVGDPAVLGPVGIGRAVGGMVAVNDSVVDTVAAAFAVDLAEGTADFAAGIGVAVEGVVGFASELQVAMVVG